MSGCDAAEPAPSLPVLTDPPPPGVTVGELLDRWLSRTRDNLSPSTLTGHERVIAGYW